MLAAPPVDKIRVSDRTTQDRQIDTYKVERRFDRRGNDPVYSEDEVVSFRSNDLTI